MLKQIRSLAEKLKLRDWGLGAARDESASAEPLRYPALPHDVTLFCVGDVHGRLDCLRGVQARIDADIADRAPPRPIEIYLGDYVDRGPESAAVITALLERRQLRRCIFLRGNHERMMTTFLAGEMPFGDWRSFGGDMTAMSYGLDPRHLASTGEAAVELLAERMPAQHRAFLSALRNSFRAGPYFFAHAGVRPGVALDAQLEGDLLWIRDEFLEERSDFGAIVVHGHTPVAAPELRRNRINVDTGAYATGNLSCLRIDGDGVAVLAG